MFALRAALRLFCRTAFAVVRSSPVATAARRLSNLIHSWSGRWIEIGLSQHDL